MYFNNFPTVPYQFPDDVVRYIKNIGIRPNIVQEFIDDATNLREYIIKDQDTPESIAFDVYGDVNLHWIIILANQITNVYKQWPRDARQLELYLFEKYKNQDDSDGYPHVLSQQQVLEYTQFSGSPTNNFESSLKFRNDSDLMAGGGVLEIQSASTDSESTLEYVESLSVKDKQEIVLIFNETASQDRDLHAVRLSYQTEIFNDSDALKVQMVSAQQVTLNDSDEKSWVDYDSIKKLSIIDALDDDVSFNPSIREFTGKYTCNNNTKVAWTLTGERYLKVVLEAAKPTAPSIDTDTILAPSRTQPVYFPLEGASVIMKPHHFEDDNDNEYSYGFITSPGTALDAFGRAVIVPTVSPISIEMIELRENEAKRSIIVPNVDVAIKINRELSKVVNGN